MDARTATDGGGSLMDASSGATPRPDRPALSPPAARHLRPAVLLGGVALIAAVLVAIALAVHLEWVAGAPVSRALRAGIAAAALGVVYALAAPAAPPGMRIAFPVIAAAMNVLAVMTALNLGELTGLRRLPAAYPPAIASTLWAGAFALASARLLGWQTDRIWSRMAPAAAAAGLSAFVLFVVARRLGAAVLPLTSLLAGYWAVWMVLVSSAVVLTTGPRRR